jgi:hypothetical protein
LVVERRAKDFWSSAKEERAFGQKEITLMTS